MNRVDKMEKVLKHILKEQEELINGDAEYITMIYEALEYVECAEENCNREVDEHEKYCHHHV